MSEPDRRGIAVPAVLQRVLRDQSVPVNATVMHELAGYTDTYPRETIERLAARLPVLLRQARQANFEARAEHLLRAIAPADPLADVMLELLEDDIEARQAFLQQIPTLTSRQVAQRAGHISANPSQTASRWRRDGRIFAVQWGGNDLYPAFQFDDRGQPHKMIERVLAVLAKDPKRTAWQNAFWFASANGWLGGVEPQAWLVTEPERVLQAAQYAVTEQPY